MGRGPGQLASCVWSRGHQPTHTSAQECGAAGARLAVAHAHPLKAGVLLGKAGLRRRGQQRLLRRLPLRGAVLQLLVQLEEADRLESVAHCSQAGCERGRGLAGVWWWLAPRQRRRARGSQHEQHEPLQQACDAMLPQHARAPASWPPAEVSQLSSTLARWSWPNTLQDLYWGFHTRNRPVRSIICAPSQQVGSGG